MEQTETIKRTGKESAILVETVITEILAKKRKKRNTMDGERIPKEWFNNLISKTCVKYNISEGHIRAVGVWSINDDVNDEDPKD
jgi:hypothetical protein